MQAIEFETQIHNRMVHIPTKYTGFKENHKARVIILFEEYPPRQTADEDFITFLTRNPKHINQSLNFLTRDKANER